MFMPETPRTSAGMIIVKDGKILLLRRVTGKSDRYKFQGYWCVPGGHVEVGETVVDGAVREAKEESGLVVKNPKFLFYEEEIFPEMDFFAVVHIFVARYSGGEVKIQEDEISEFKWVTIEEALKENLAFSYKKILERIRDEFGDILK